MLKFILVTILPAITLLTAFLFNVGIRETIENRHGLNTYYFKTMGILLASIYSVSSLAALGMGLGLLEDVETNFEKFNKAAPIILIAAIYFCFYYKLKTKRDNIFSKSNKYEPNPSKSNAYIFLGLMFPIISSISSPIDIDTLKEISNLVNDQGEIIFTTNGIYVLAIIFMYYVFTIIAAGYIYNYGRLLNFKLYKIVFSEEFKDLLDILDIEHDGNTIDGYILVETDESMMIKIHGEEKPAIKIKKDYILNLMIINKNELDTLEAIDVVRVEEGTDSMANNNNNNNFMPTVAIVPGETIRESMKCLRMSQKELAVRLDITEKHVSNIINGKSPITYEIALKLESIIGPSAQFWMKLESNYQLTKARLEE